MSLSSKPLFEGKKGLFFGVANERSLAWGIAHQLAAQGATIGFTHFPDSSERRKNEKKLRRIVEPIGDTGRSASFVFPCDVTNDDDLDRVFAKAEQDLGAIDFLLHSVAFAPPSDLTRPVYMCSRDGFPTGMNVSVYSLVAMCHRMLPIMNRGGSVLSLTYLGGERVIPGCNLMGV